MAFTDWIADELEEDVETDVEVVDEIDNEDTEIDIEEEQLVEDVQEDVSSTPQTFNINGQDLTIDEIQNGYMRQQDYITQREEINKLREENKQALELVEYLRKNPSLAQKLMNDEEAPTNVTSVVNPAMERIERLEKELYVNKINANIEGLKKKYNDFNEVEVLNRAVQMGTNDLEFVYHGMRGANIDDIVAQKVKEQLANANIEMQKNSNATRTVIGNAKHTEVSKSHNLTQQEMRVADMMGLSYSDYQKYK